MALLGGAMTLFLVGIVAVILVILVAAFLTFRRAQDDDRDEPGGRWAVGDRVRSAGRDGRWRAQAQELRRQRRPERTGPAGRLRGYDEPPPAYAARRTGRGHRDQQGERGYPARSAGRYADDPEGPDYPDSRGRGSRAAVSPTRGQPPGGRPAGRQQPAGYEPVGYDPGPREQLYDTGPSPTMNGSTSMSGEHKFAAERDDDSALADSDVFPRVRTDNLATASEPQAPAKSRPRQSRTSKRGDDDDWPSTEWDKLSDEQYWAELSADKPLATTARAAQPSDTSAVSGPARPSPDQPRQAQPRQDQPRRAQPSPDQPRQAQPRQAQPRQAQPRRAQARPASTSPGRSVSGPAQPQPEREPVAPRRRDRQQEEHTEVLPARSRPRPAAAPGAPAAAAPPSMPQQAGEPSLAMLTSLATGPRAMRADPAARDNDDPLTSPSYSRQATPAQDGRSYRSGGRDRPRGSTSDYPGGDYPTGRYPNGSTGSYPNGRHVNGTGPQGYRAEDRELTNPQAAYPAAWPGHHLPPAPPLAAPPPAAPPPVPSRGPAGNPYGSYVDSSPATTEDRARPDTGYGSYPTDPGTGYPEAPWPPAAPDPATDPASHYLYTGGSGYPDAAGYGAGRPAVDAGYPATPPEPTGYVPDAYNGAGYADGYSTDPYDPDAYGGYRPRQA
jgi:hypothetical protein